MRTKLIAALLACVVATPAFAGDITKTADGYTYFNRAGADLATHDAEVRDCRLRSATLYQPDTSGPTYAPGLIGAITVAIAKAIIQAAHDHTGRMVNIENCMVVKGWRVVALDADQGRTVAALDQKGKAAKLTDWVGAEAPPGAIVRTYVTDGPLTYGTGQFASATHKADTALSTDAVIKESKPDEKGKGAATDDPLPSPPPLPRMKGSAKPPKPLKAEELGGIPADSALIVINIRGTGPFSLTFERIGPNADTPAWVDGRPASFIISQSGKAFANAGTTEGATVAFAVPPGRWRIASLTSSLFTTSFCMGSPAFDVKADEVVYAGSFSPGLGKIDPDMTIEPAKAVFPAVSNLSERVRAADYANGSLGGRCFGAYLYALEFHDRPFPDGYAMAARSPLALAAAAAMAVPATPPVAQAAAAPVAPSPETPPVTPAVATTTAIAPTPVASTSAVSTPAASPPATVAPAVHAPTATPAVATSPGH